MRRTRGFFRAILPPIVVSSTRQFRRRLRYRRGRHSGPEIALSDGVVQLRLIDERDRGLVDRAAKDPEIRRRFGLLKTRPHDYFAYYWHGSRSGKAVAFTICDARGAGSGLVTVERRSAGRAQLGYWLLPDGRGRGYSTRALRLVSRWALDQPDVFRLQLTTAPDNTASQRVAERSGYRREGVLRSYQDIDGRREDAVLFSLVPSDLDAVPAAEVRLEDALVQAVEDSGKGLDASVDIMFHGAEDVLVPQEVVVPVVAPLLENAVLYGRTEVRVIAQAAPGSVSVTVEDSGRGVDDSFVPFLFKPHMRSKRSAAEARGRGLGLAQARTKAREHGGDVRYEPKPGGGARFVAVFGGPSESREHADVESRPMAEAHGRR